MRSHPCEVSAMIYLRKQRQLSINQIAEVLGRSTSTVYDHVKQLDKRINNRTNTAFTKALNKSRFESQKLTMKIQLKTYFAGIVDYISEALGLKTLPLILVDNLARMSMETENTTGSEEDKPP